MVWNPLAHNRTDVVTIDTHDAAVQVVDDTGSPVPAVVDHEREPSVRGRRRAALGRRCYPPGTGPCRVVLGSRSTGPRSATSTTRCGGSRPRGAVDSLRHHERELLTPGRLGNELAVYAEYSAHPQAGEGPWHLLPKGPVVGPARRPPRWAHRSPAGERLVVTGRIVDGAAPSCATRRP